jgi:hypothetical protein
VADRLRLLRNPLTTLRKDEHGSCPLAPTNKRCAVTLTFDFDSETNWLSRDPSNWKRPGTLSQGTYGAKGRRAEGAGTAGGRRDQGDVLRPRGSRKTGRSASR